MWVEIIILITAAAAAFIQVTTGFGISIIIMTVLPMIMPVAESSFLLCFSAVIVTSYIILKYWKSINFKSLILPLAFALAGSYLGVTALLKTENYIAVKFLGSLLIILALYFYKYQNRIKIPKNIFSASTAGICSGLMNGFFNMGGPPIVLYYSTMTEDKNEYSATVQFFFAVMAVFKIIVLILGNGAPVNVFVHVPLAAAGSLVGMFAGIYLFKKLSIDTIKKFIYIIMIIAGIWYIIK
ncbi:MAG TPA: sulfite exporter TauE/SafE family protein [Clostridia bacterium]